MNNTVWRVLLVHETLLRLGLADEPFETLDLLGSIFVFCNQRFSRGIHPATLAVSTVKPQSEWEQRKHTPVRVSAALYAAKASL
jgi:hypothetical protein